MEQRNHADSRMGGLFSPTAPFLPATLMMLPLCPVCKERVHTRILHLLQQRTAILQARQHQPDTIKAGTQSGRQHLIWLAMATMPGVLQPVKAQMQAPLPLPVLTRMLGVQKPLMSALPGQPSAGGLTSSTMTGYLMTWSCPEEFQGKMAQAVQRPRPRSLSLQLGLQLILSRRAAAQGQQQAAGQSPQADMRLPSRGMQHP